MVCLMSSFYQKYCLWVTSNFFRSHCQNLTLPNLKYSQVGLKLFWKNGAQRERSTVESLRIVMMHSAETESGFVSPTLYANVTLRKPIISQSVLG